MLTSKKQDRLFATGFILPSFLVYTSLMIVPIALSVWYSLNSWNGTTPMLFSGIKNYGSLLTKRVFSDANRNSLVYVVISLILQMSMGYLFAYLLFRTRKMFKVYRAIFFFPSIVAPIAVALMFSSFYNGDFGVFNTVLKAAGLKPVAWLTKPGIVQYAVMVPHCWQYVGVYVLIFLTAMQGIDDSVLESAAIDGADSWVICAKICFPLTWHTIQVATVLCITGALKVFDHIWVLTQGGPGTVSASLAVSIYKTSFLDMNIGLGSSIGVVILVYGLVATVACQWIFSRDPIESR